MVTPYDFFLSRSLVSPGENFGHKVYLVGQFHFNMHNCYVYCFIIFYNPKLTKKIFKCQWYCTKHCNLNFSLTGGRGSFALFCPIL